MEKRLQCRIPGVEILEFSFLLSIFIHWEELLHPSSQPITQLQDCPARICTAAAHMQTLPMRSFFRALGLILGGLGGFFGNSLSAEKR